MATAATVERIALIEDTNAGPRARYTFPATEDGAAKAQARITALVAASSNEFRLVAIANQPKK